MFSDPFLADLEQEGFNRGFIKGASLSQIQILKGCTKEQAEEYLKMFPDLSVLGKIIYAKYLLEKDDSLSWIAFACQLEEEQVKFVQKLMKKNPV